MVMILVDKADLASLITDAYAADQERAVEGGNYTRWEEEWKFMDPDEAMTRLCLQAGIPFPGPWDLSNGPPPPPPPGMPFDVSEVARLIRDCITNLEEMGHEF